MNLEQISVFIITKNEAQNLERLLPLLAPFPEIVIVDSGSTDATRDVAERFANVRFIHQDWLGFSAQKDFARRACSKPWVFNLDADETFDPELLTILSQTVAQDDVAGLSVDCAEILLGKHIPHRLTDHRPKLRFFKRDRGHYPNAAVHEKIKLDGKTRHTKHRIYNWGSDLQTLLAKQNEYSRLAAEERVAKGKKTSLLKIVGKFPFAFFKYYVLKRHFLDGVPGFISAVNYAHYTFQKEAKIYAMTSDRD